jgi:Bacterial regulatory proteins, luxR family
MEPGVSEVMPRPARIHLLYGEWLRRRGQPWRRTDPAAHRGQACLEGLTNPQIGTTLYISPKTLEWQMRNILMKLARYQETRGVIDRLSGCGFVARRPARHTDNRRPVVR